MMLFFSILSVLVSINILLIIFSVNKTAKTKIKQSVIYKVNKNTAEVDYSSENVETDIVYKKAI